MALQRQRKLPPLLTPKPIALPFDLEIPDRVDWETREPGDEAVEEAPEGGQAEHDEAEEANFSGFEDPEVLEEDGEFGHYGGDAEAAEAAVYALGWVRRVWGER